MESNIPAPPLLQSPAIAYFTTTVGPGLQPQTTLTNLSLPPSESQFSDTYPPSALELSSTPPRQPDAAAESAYLPSFPDPGSFTVETQGDISLSLTSNNTPMAISPATTFPDPSAGYEVLQQSMEPPPNIVPSPPVPLTSTPPTSSAVPPGTTRSRAGTVSSSSPNTPALADPRTNQESRKILKSIAKVAMSSTEALERHDATKAQDLIGELKLQIEMLSELVDGLQLRRKRCASVMREERPMKSLKAESHEVSLSDSASSFVAHGLEHTPGHMAATDYIVIKQEGSNFAPEATYSYAPLTVPLVGRGPETSSNLPSSSQMPILRQTYSEPVVATRRHTHSLSTGSIRQSHSSTDLHRGVPGVLSSRGQRSGSIGGGYPTATTAPSFNFTLENGAPWTKRTVSTGAVPVILPAPVGASIDEDEEDPTLDEDLDTRAGTDPPSSGDNGNTSTNSDIPQEFRADVERIFFEYLNKICSNLSATDSKGEPIHQTLMKKKMDRLDESKDFRPFKFRIAAFTSGFMEELANQGFPEDRIPMKKVRNYLWRQPHIQRFNDDGKKVKTKGNHVWLIDAKKRGDGNWEFRPFERKFAGMPPPVAYCGLRWSWTARLWDPQASWQNMSVKFRSPDLPSWLQWEGDVLTGVPPPGAQPCEITVVADFTVEGQKKELVERFKLSIAPVSTPVDAFVQSVREIPRTVNDPSPPRPPPLARPPPQAPEAAANEVVADVLQNVSRVTAPHLVPPDYQRLAARQRVVVEESINAFEQAVSGNTTNATYALAVAAKSVVVEAAQTTLSPMAAAQGTAMPLAHDAVQLVSVPAMVATASEAIALSIQEKPFAPSAVILNNATSILRNHQEAVIQQTFATQTRATTAAYAYPTDAPPVPEYV